MRNKDQSRRVWCFLVSLTIWAFVGCLNPFAPKLDHKSAQGQFITSQSTPEEVLQNFGYSYTFRDSLLYADLLDSAFIFEYFDPNVGESGLFESWGRDVELRTTGKLFRAFDAIELIWLNTIYQTSENDQRETMYRNFRVTFVNSEFNIALQGYAIFTFQLGKDGKWRLLHWVDESSL